MRLSVVILNWNGRHHLERYLPSVVEHSSGEAVVIVADNGSTDDSIAWLAEHYPEVGVIALDANYGFAGGYNKALAQVEAEYYLLLNSDIEVTQGWLDPMLQYMDSHAHVAACQPKLMDYKDPAKFEFFVEMPDKTTVVLWPYKA